MKTSRSLLLALVTGCAATAHAGVWEYVSSGVQTTNYTSYIVSVDEFSGRVPDRSRITGALTMTFGWDTLNDDSANYDVRFALWDEVDNVVPIVPVGGGPAVSEISTVQNVALNAGTQELVQTFTTAFRPATRLLPNKRYRITARYRREPQGGVYGSFINVPLHFSAQNTFVQRYQHFPNTTNGDASANVRVSTGLGQFARNWMIVGSPTQSTYRLQYDITAERFDAFNDEPTSADIDVTLITKLRRATDNVLLYTLPAYTVTLSMLSHAGGTGSAADPSNVHITPFHEFAVPAGIITPGTMIKVEVEGTHTGEEVASGLDVDGQTTLGYEYFVRFSGNLLVGSTAAQFDELDQNFFSYLANWFVSPPEIPIQVTSGHGTFAGAPGVTFGGNITVQVLPNGDAVKVGTAPILLDLPNPSPVIGNVSLSLYGVKLTNTGPTANIRLNFPQGFGIMQNPSMTNTAADGLYFIDEPLTSSFQLPPVLSQSYPFEGFCERVPLRFSSSFISFNTTTGAFTIGSGAWIDPLKSDRDYLTNAYFSNQLANPLAVFRPSNMGYYANAHDDAFTSLTITADTAGRAELTGRMDFSNVSGTYAYAPHFPFIAGGAGSPLGYAITAGHLQLNANVPDSTSFVDGIQKVRIFYRRDLSSGPCAGSAGPGEIMMDIDGTSLRFTKDGGLVGGGPVVSVAPVNWGTLPNGTQFAHQLPLYATATFQMPGHWLHAAESPSIAPHFRAVTMLHSGFEKPGDLTYFERPGLLRYHEDGQANYAGITLRAPLAGIGTAVSRIAGQAASYDLTGESRHYIRAAGVTGITDAADPFNLNDLYGGFDLNLDVFSLAFQDGINTDSRTAGSVHVGDASPSASPVEFTLAFSQLFLSPEGHLTSGELVENQPTKTLRYWSTSFKPLAISFRQPVPVEGQPCPGMNDGFLAVGMEATLPLLAPQKVHGVLGFAGNGDLLGKGDPLTQGTGVDSRFQLPANVPIAADNGTYTLQPVARAYLNKWSVPGVTRPASGFLNIAGRLDVPFFEAMKVHVHADGSSSFNNVHYMGGWAQSDDPLVNGEGWQDASGSFFSAADFDPVNVGFPGNDVQAYRDVPSSTAYKPRAFKNWFGVMSFDYPLRRSPTSTSFVSANVKEQDVLLFGIKHQVKRMTASGAELVFDAQLTDAMPNLSLGSLMTNVGVPNSIASKFQGAAGIDVAALTGALDGLDGLMRDTLITAIKPQLQGALSVSVDTLYSNLVSKYDEVGQDNGLELFTALNTNAVRDDLRSEVVLAFSSLLLPNSGHLTVSAANRVKAVKDQVGPVRDAAVAISDITALGQAVGQLLTNDPGPSNTPEQNTALTDALNTIHGAANGLNELYGTLNTVEANLRTGLGSVSQELHAIDDALPPVHAIADKAIEDVGAMVIALPCDHGQLLLDYPEAEMKGRIERILLDRFLASQPAADLQRIFKSYLAEIRSQVFTKVDTILGEMEGAARVRGALPEVTKPSLGDIGAALKSTGLKGFARINGDTLEMLRLDGRLNLDILGGMTGGAASTGGIDMHAFIEARSQHANTPIAACKTGGKDSVEVTIGADGVPLGWAGFAKAKADASLKVGFLETGAPNGFDGALIVNGDIKIAGAKISSPKVVLGAGSNQMYAGMELAGEFQGKEAKLRGFFGRVCDFAPLQVINPNAASALTRAQQAYPALSPPFNGVNVYAEAWMPLNEILGIPTTCLLNLRAGAGAGMSFFVPDSFNPIVLGSQSLLGLSGEVLCAIHAKGTMEMNGVAVLDINAGDGALSLQGNGQVSAKIGVSPLSKTFKKSIGVSGTYNIGTGKRSLDVDF